MVVILPLLQVTQFLRSLQQNTTYPSDVCSQLVYMSHKSSFSVWSLPSHWPDKHWPIPYFKTSPVSNSCYGNDWPTDQSPSTTGQCSQLDTITRCMSHQGSAFIVFPHTGRQGCVWEQTGCRTGAGDNTTPTINFNSGHSDGKTLHKKHSSPWLCCLSEHLHTRAGHNELCGQAVSRCLG